MHSVNDRSCTLHSAWRGVRNLLSLAVAAVISANVVAHHAYAPEFGKSLVSCAEGSVLAVRWQSPHIQIDVALNGRFENEYEMVTLQSQAPTILKKNYELDKNSVKVGDSILVRGRASNLGTNIYQMLSMSVNGSPEMPLSTQGVPEIGEYRPASTGETRQIVREELETGADTSAQTTCEDIALFAADA